MVIIYSARTGRIRRRIFEGDQVQSDAQLLAIHGPEVGEESRVGANVTQAQLSAITGLVPINDRYAIVDPVGDVVNFEVLDQTIDSREGLTLVAHATAGVGWRQMLDGTFQRPLSMINHELTNVTNALARFQARQAALPPGDARKLNASQLAAEIARRNQQIGVLQAERAARQAPR